MKEEILINVTPRESRAALVENGVLLRFDEGPETNYSVAPDQHLVIIAPMEPIPLIGLLAQRGFSHSSKLRSDDAWEVTFRPGSGLL